MDYNSLSTESFETDSFRITLNKRGENGYVKQRSPVVYGIYSEIETESSLLQFNLNNEIFRAEGRDKDWASDLEYLKRTIGNDWVYYSTGGYAGSWETLTDASFPSPVSFRVPEPYSEVYKTTGEYYLPNLQYDSNAIIGGSPFESSAVKRIVDNWYEELSEIRRVSEKLPSQFRDFLTSVIENSPEQLGKKAGELFTTCGGRMSVLPPDSRHVDYGIIPVNISRGCLYKCRFCTVKNSSVFSSFSKDRITDQLDELATSFGENLINYNSIFLGEHDALNAEDEIILFAITQALKRLKLDSSYMHGRNVFLFGSVSALMKKDEDFFNKLNNCGLNVFINLGLESTDQKTLDYIGKPLKSSQVIECFELMQLLNSRFEHIECTANFLFDEKLPAGHIPAFLDLVGGTTGTPQNKGTVYLSPLCLTRPSARTLYEFKQLKTFSNYPTYLYLIQRA
ncbi:radical SAM protein [Maridesulfovibrio frigidus]|uniref:radical SAM protein n=1 Tax=Maridesulfovibrio frigidus TaxID=340956 RepID=UPI0004E1B328|nr:radical SAM protein [Maridesulfovibrio frigidus]